MSRHRPITLFSALAAAVACASAGADDVPALWRESVDAAALVKRGICHAEAPPGGYLEHPHYQCETIGLGGTVVRVGPHGFTAPAAPAIDRTGHLESRPYISQQHWWDEAAHRHQPFEVVGGYGPDVVPGDIRSFRHRLDIARGVLDIDLQLAVDGSTWRSRRESFVTPAGVWVIRIIDTEPALPFRLRIAPNENVRIYLNSGVYAGPHDPWTATAAAVDRGLVVTATRPRSCTATLAVAIDASGAVVDPGSRTCSAGAPGGPITLFIAPASSYADDDPAARAWERAEAARSRGFDALRAETAEWWRSYHAASAVVMPDAELTTWYARSLWYLGVFFGETDVPPGCNGTSLESFAGAVCPEYDLVLDQLALLATNHFAEARRVADWAGRTLPKARATRQGLTLHDVSVSYPRGAKYGPLVGHDGTVLAPPTAGEAVWAYEDFAGTNLALVALAYVDWAADMSRSAIASDLLRETTQVMAEELAVGPDLGGRVHRRMPSTVQQSAAAFGLRESLRRGVADEGWDGLAADVLMPTAEVDGGRVLAGGPGSGAGPGRGDATWLVPLWWYGVVGPDDPLVRPTYAMVCGSRTGDYVFNNAWMGVIAAKLRDGAEALRWAKACLRPGVTLFDDNCLGEIVNDREDFKKTPEVAAHAALVCNVAQMLLDPDGDREIAVFPAVPPAWQGRRVAFSRLAARGGILVSAESSPERLSVTLENRAAEPQIRTLRVRLPADAPPPTLRDATVADGWAVVPDIHLAPGESRRLDLVAGGAAADDGM